MDTYADRVGKFNDMISSTNQHIKAVQDAALKFKDTKDPIGLGLTVTGAASGGIGGVAGSYAGIQHFKDFKTMYKGLSSKLQGKGRALSGQTSNADNPNGGNAGSADPVQSSGGNAADGNANQAPDPAPATRDVDGGVQDGIDNLETSPNIKASQQLLNSQIEQKVGDELGVDGRSFLNDAARASGRGADKTFIRNLPEGDLRTAAQKSLLNFKNKVANDAIERSQSGRTPASGYDNDGNPTGDVAGPQPKPTQVAPDGSANPVAPDNGVNLAPDANAPAVAPNAAGDAQNIAQGADSDANGIIAQGRAALAGLRQSMVPGRAGQAVQGLRANAPQLGDLNSQAANAGARVQQGAANQAQHALAPGRNPNGNQAPTADNTGAGANGGGDNINPGQGARPGAAAADADGAGAGADAGAGAGAAGAGAESGEAIAGGIGAGLDEAAAFSGPAAPIIGLIGGLISLGTTIAGLFHKKPPPTKIAPPPVATASIGGNLKDTLSGMGGGIF